jgi:N-acetyltransferase
MAADFLNAAGPDVRPPAACSDTHLADGWRHGLPTLRGHVVTLREFRATDALALLETVSNGDVARFLSPPPQDEGAAERFIEWTHRQRSAGCYACFAVTQNRADRVIGLFQVRRLDPGFETAEWGFALDARSWGSGAFMDGAALTLQFAFGLCGVRRLEARVAAANGRGNAALRKMGAANEGLVRRVLVDGADQIEEVLWTLTLRDAARSRYRARTRVH